MLRPAGERWTMRPPWFRVCLGRESDGLRPVRGSRPRSTDWWATSYSVQASCLTPAPSTRSSVTSFWRTGRKRWLPRKSPLVMLAFFVFWFFFSQVLVRNLPIWNKFKFHVKTKNKNKTKFSSKMKLCLLFGRTWISCLCWWIMPLSLSGIWKVCPMMSCQFRTAWSWPKPHASPCWSIHRARANLGSRRERARTNCR